MFSNTDVASRLTTSNIDNVHLKANIMQDLNKVKQYFQKVKTFKEELFSLVYLTVGAPARGTKIISIQYKNSKESSL